MYSEKADKTFRVRRDQLQTAVNDDGFEIDVIRRLAIDNDPHPLPMSDKEEDLWAVQVSSGNQLVSGRRHEQMVVSAKGDMALMRTVHPLDFIRVKTALASSVDRDPLKRPKDSLQAQVVQALGTTICRTNIVRRHQHSCQGLLIKAPGRSTGQTGVEIEGKPSPPPAWPCSRWTTGQCRAIKRARAVWPKGFLGKWGLGMHGN